MPAEHDLPAAEIGEMGADARGRPRPRKLVLGMTAASSGSGSRRSSVWPRPCGYCSLTTIGTSEPGGGGKQDHGAGDHRIGVGDGRREPRLDVDDEQHALPSIEQHRGASPDARGIFTTDRNFAATSRPFPARHGTAHGDIR